MYKCCMNQRHIQQQQQQQLVSKPQTPLLTTNTSNTTAASSSLGNCSSCQISAAAASFQLANFIGSTMLLPAAIQNATKNVAAVAPTSAFATHKTSANQIVVSGAATNSSSSSTNVAAAAAATLPSAAATSGMPKKSTVQFHCEFCTFACSWKYDLKLHLRQKHGIHNKKM